MKKSTMQISDKGKTLITARAFGTWIAFSVVCCILVMTLFFFNQIMTSYYPAYSYTSKIAIVYVIVMSIIAILLNEFIVILIHKAKRIKKHDESPEYWEIVSTLSQKAKIAMPRVYIIPDSDPNACAFGLGFFGQYGIAVTQGLLDNMNKEQLKGVVAHELGHIMGKDIATATILAMIVASFTQIADWSIRYMGFWENNKDKSKNSQDSEKSHFVGILIALGILIIFALIGKIIGPIMQLWVSRMREFAADAKAALILDSPYPLISALEFLKRYKASVTHNALTATLFFVPVTASMQARTSTTIFDTHPALNARIQELEKISQ